MEKRDEEQNLWSQSRTKERHSALVVEEEGAFSGGVKVDLGELDQFAVANVHFTVQALRERGIEGHVVFEGDSTCYEFTPETDFVYPAAVHQDMPAFGKMSTWRPFPSRVIHRRD